MSFIIDFSDIVDLLTCVGVIFAILEFRMSRKATLALYEKEKKQSTIEMFKEYEASFHEYNRIIYKKYKYKNMTYGEITNDEKIRKIIHKYLNELEFICTGVNIGVYEINTLERLFGDVIVRIYYQTLPYIEYLRNERKTKIVYAEFEIVAKEMEKIQSKKKEPLNKNADLKYKL